MQRLYRAPAEPATLVIRGARLVDPGSALAGERLDVLVTDGVIAAIGPDLEAALIRLVKVRLISRKEDFVVGDSSSSGRPTVVLD